MQYTSLVFQVKTFDFLQKPVTKERLEQTLIRLFDDINFSSNNFISLNNKTFINQNDIHFIQRNGMKLVFNTLFATYETYSSFNKISDKLQSNFVRCHKSYIVNINNISHIEASTNTLFFNDNSKCYIGPKYKNKFMEVINNGLTANNL